jgi:putative ABC transport system ATP-binding protein
MACPTTSSPVSPIDAGRPVREPELMRITTGDDEQERPAVRGPAPLAGDAAAVELAGVTKSYGRGRRAVMALDGVSAVFAPGSFSAVMGLSGSGKSTLLQMSAGLDRPTSGTVRLGGSDLSGLSGRRLSVLRRRRVGFVFQELNLVPSLSVAENIALPLRLDHKPVDKSRIRELAGLVGIDGLLPRLPHTLSGGQQQRVAIARALVTRPEVIFADEPTTALDPYTSEAIVGLLRRAVDELGQTVVVVTHDPTVAARADHVLVLDQGRLAGVVSGRTAAELTAILRRLGEQGAR